MIVYLVMMASLFLSNQTSSNSSLDRCLQEELKVLKQKHSFPGATCAYALSDGTVGEVAIGVADLETREPMTEQSRMLAASIGKTFVGATIVSLEKEGLIDLDGPLSDWLKERPWYSRLPNHDTITIRHLLTHRSGLPDHVHSPKFLKSRFFNKFDADNPFSPELLIECILDQPPLFEAGRGWSYTDTGYILLGLIIEAATGRYPHDVVKELFLNPLKLDGTSPSDSPRLPGLAAGYTTPDNPFGLPIKTLDESGTMIWNPVFEWTGGGIVSTSRDLAVWAKLLYEGDAMQVDYLEELLQGAPISEGSDARYGLGVAMQKTSFGDKWGHYGVIPGYVSSMRYYPEYGLALAFQVNTDVNASDLINDMEQSLAEIVIIPK